MKRVAVAVIGAAVLLPSVSVTAIGQESSPEISIRIAKTARFVKPFGTATTEKVRVSLFKERPSGDKLLGSKGVRVEEGSYRTRFDRPLRGMCRVAVFNAHDRTVETFPCYIPDFPRGTAQMTAGVTDAVEIRVLIAETDEQRQYGLMYRPRLPSDLGMAFLWEQDTSGGFWMKNTLIPLSIAFFDANGVILRIMDMEPCTEDPCRSYDPGVSYRGALEVNQGSFDDWSVSEGDRIDVLKE